MLKRVVSTKDPVTTRERGGRKGTALMLHVRMTKPGLHESLIEATEKSGGSLTSVVNELLRRGLAQEGRLLDGDVDGPHARLRTTMRGLGEAIECATAVAQQEQLAEVVEELKQLNNRVAVIEARATLELLAGQ